MIASATPKANLLRSASIAYMATLPMVLASATACAGTETVLYGFSGGADGGEPRGTLIADKAGNLYGTTYRGGTLTQCAGIGCGTVFELSPPAAGQTQWTETPIYAFSGIGDGANPVAGLVMDKQGNVYGATQRGGGSLCGGFGCGTIFKLKPPASGSNIWTQAILYRFSGPDGAIPMCDLAFDANGNLLGTTSQGGAANAGAVFRLDAPPPNSSTWTEEVLYSFTGLLDGGNPGAAVTTDAAGNIYGTAVNGGSALSGVVFQLVPSAQQLGTWSQNVLFNFPGAANGGYPRSALTMDSAGNLYGVATNIAFELSPPANGGAWGESVLHGFLSGADGNIPFAGMAMVNYASSTAFYGTAGFGGTSRVGVVYKLVAPTATNPNWVESLLYRFTGQADGSNPYGGLVAGTGGVLYGTTTFGGTLTNCDFGCGVIFEVTP